MTEEANMKGAIYEYYKGANTINSSNIEKLQNPDWKKLYEELVKSGLAD